MLIKDFLTYANIFWFLLESVVNVLLLLLFWKAVSPQAYAWFIRAQYFIGKGQPSVSQSKAVQELEVNELT